MVKFDNIIKSIIPAAEMEQSRTEIRYAIAYNGSSQSAIKNVILDLNRQLETLVEQGVE